MTLGLYAAPLFEPGPASEALFSSKADQTGGARGRCADLWPVAARATGAAATPIASLIKHGSNQDLIPGIYMAPLAVFLPQQLVP